jgi:hypothetical protein
MTDHDFRDLFARLDEAPDPRPEFVERLLRDFDALAAPPGATPGPPGTTVHGPTDPNGSRPGQAYLVEPPDHEMVAIARPRVPRRRAVAVVAAVAAVIVATVAVAVTRPGTHPRPKPVAPPHLPGAQLQLYWEDADGIGRTNLDGTGMTRQLIPLGAETLCGGTVAADRNYVYWINGGRGGNWGEVARARRDGTGVDQSFITTTPPYVPQCVAVDGAHIYWTSVLSTGATTGPFTETIGRANLDGTGVQESIISDSNGSCGLAVDGAHIYWGRANGIGRANLDGTGVNLDFIKGGGTCGTVVDGAHIYWVGPNGTIGRANLDGTGVNESFITPGVPGSAWHPCAQDGTYLYWMSGGPGGNNSIGRVRLDGTGVQGDFVTGLNSPSGCAIGPGATTESLTTATGAIGPGATTESPTTATGALTPPVNGSGPDCSPGYPIVFAPGAGLADGQVVQVVGKCAPGVTYTVAECADSSMPVLGTPPVGDCFSPFSRSVIADATGTVSTYLKVQKVFLGVDCGVAPGCVVSLSREGANGSSSFVQISFGA